MVAKGWSDEKKKAYVIADNKLAEKGSWDNAVLYSELKAINDSQFDLSLMGAEDDFALMDFSPNLEPSFTSHQIDDQNIQQANENISNQIDFIQQDKSLNGIEVTCPYCAESFKFTGV